MTIQMAGIVANFAFLMVISPTHHSIYNAAAQSLSMNLPNIRCVQMERNKLQKVVLIMTIVKIICLL